MLRLVCLSAGLCLALLAGGVVGAKSVGNHGFSPSATPIEGTWSSGGHQLRVSGTLEGGFTVTAAQSWMIFGCPVAAGTVIYKYSPKGGSSYDLTWLVVSASTTQGVEGVKCENTYEGPRTVTVVRSKSGTLDVSGCGDACSSMGASFKPVSVAPATTTKPTTTAKPKPAPKPKVKDTVPPQVRAFNTKGFATQGKPVYLTFTVKDDSGRARVHNTVYEGGKLIGTAVSPWLAANGQVQSWPSTIGADNVGPLYYCLWAEDAAGNKSSEKRNAFSPREFRDEPTRSCAWIPLVVAAESVGNTCGGEGWDAFVEVQHYFGNVHTYVDSNTNPTAPSYTVDFSQACNVHDAGYGGYAIWDPFSGGKAVDFRTLARPKVDSNFLANLRTLCAQKIPATAKTALANCQGKGGNATVGALYLYNLVAKIGWRFFDADLTKAGIQKSGHRDNFD